MSTSPSSSRARGLSCRRERTYLIIAYFIDDDRCTTRPVHCSLLRLQWSFFVRPCVSCPIDILCLLPLPSRHLAFLTDMRDFFVSGGCGPVNYVDVYNMTRSLVLGHPDEAKTMTYDMAHWGMAVNLIKARMILNAILQEQA